MTAASSIARMPLKVFQPWMRLASPKSRQDIFTRIEAESKMELDKGDD